MYLHGLHTYTHTCIYLSQTHKTKNNRQNNDRQSHKNVKTLLLQNFNVNIHLEVYKLELRCTTGRGLLKRQTVATYDCMAVVQSP